MRDDAELPCDVMHPSVPEIRIDCRVDRDVHGLDSTRSSVYPALPERQVGRASSCEMIRLYRWDSLAVGLGWMIQRLFRKTENKSSSDGIEACE